MQGGQGPLGEPGRSIYIARRIVAAVVVLFVLALVGNGAWHSFLKPTPESGSDVLGSAGMSSSGSSTAETPTEEGSTTSTEENVVSDEESQESLQGRAQASTQGTTESPEVVDLIPVTVSPVPAAPAVSPPVAFPVNTSLSEGIPPAPTSNTPPPLPSPPAGATNEVINQASQVPSNAAQFPPPSPPIITQPQTVQPIALEEPVTFMEPAAFEGEPPLGETTFTEEAPFEGSALEEGFSAHVIATAGDAVAISGRGATARSGTVAAIAG